MVATVAAIAVGIGAVKNDAIHSGFNGVIGGTFVENGGATIENITNGVDSNLPAGKGAGADIASFGDEIFVRHSGLLLLNDRG